MGFAEFGSVSVIYLQFSEGSNIFVCMSCSWSHSSDAVCWRLRGVSSPSLGLILLSFSHTVTQASSHRTSVLTGCWLTTHRSYKSFLRAWCRRKCNVCMTDLDSPCTCVYQVDCSVCPPGYGGFCMLADVSGFSLGQEVRIDSLLVSELAWSGSTFKVLKYKLKAYSLSKHDMPGSRAQQSTSASLSTRFRFFAILYTLSVLSVWRRCMAGFVLGLYHLTWHE